MLVIPFHTWRKWSHSSHHLPPGLRLVSLEAEPKTKDFYATHRRGRETECGVAAKEGVASDGAFCGLIHRGSGSQRGIHPGARGRPFISPEPSVTG